MGLMRQSLPTFIISFIILIVGIYMLGYWLLVCKSEDVDATLLYLGLFSVILGLWTANETNFAKLLLVNQHATTFAAYILLMAMPIPFVLFVRSFLDFDDKKYLACILWFQHGDVRDQLCFAFYGNLGITTESDSDTYCYCRTIDLSDESNCV